MFPCCKFHCGSRSVMYVFMKLVLTQKTAGCYSWIETETFFFFPTFLSMNHVWLWGARAWLHEPLTLIRKSICYFCLTCTNCKCSSKTLSVLKDKSEHPCFVTSVIGVMSLILYYFYWPNSKITVLNISHSAITYCSVIHWLPCELTNFIKWSINKKKKKKQPKRHRGRKFAGQSMAYIFLIYIIQC